MPLPPAEAEAEEPGKSGPPPYIPGFEDLVEIGRGATGRVFRARRSDTGDVVALKTLRYGQDASLADRGAFSVEAERLRQFSHPHIVKLEEVGMDPSGQPFLCLEFVRGGTLAGKLMGRPQDPDQAAALTATLAEAIDQVHLFKLIHRDLKPANILLTSPDADDPLRDCVPKITDFGLARELTEKGARRSSFGQVKGTFAYMPPEQAVGLHLDARADIYALGAILYEMLTGGPPCRGATPEETHELARSTDPVIRPRQLVPTIAPALETICLKCLEKYRRDRYQSAGELARELRRFLKGERIQTRPLPAQTRLLRWAQGRPALAVLYAAIVLLAVGATGAAVVFDAQARQNLLLANNEKQAKLAETEQRVLAIASAKHAGEQRNLAVQEGRLAREAKLNADRRRYVSDMRLIQRAWGDNEMDRVRELLDGLLPGQTGGTDLRAFEWYYWQRLSHSEVHTLRGHTNWVPDLSFSPDGKRLASASFDRTAMVWDVETGRELFTYKGHTGPVISVTFSPDGKQVASTATDGLIKVWDATSGEEAFSCETGNAKYYTRRVAYSPDGKYLAGAVQRMDLQTGALSAERVKVWDAGTGKERPFSLAGGQSGWFGNLVYSPDGTRLAGTLSTRDPVRDRVKVWDAATGNELLSLKKTIPPLAGLVYNPAGTLLAGASLTDPVTVWDAATLKKVCTCKGYKGEIHGVSFNRDGTRLAGACYDRTVKLWELPSGLLLRSIRGHADGVLAVVFSPDGKRFASASNDHTVKVWDVAVNQEPLSRPQEVNAMVWHLAFSPDGQRLAGTAGERSIKVWDTVDFREVLTFQYPSARVSALAYSPDGRSLAVGGNVWNEENEAVLYGTLSLWDAVTGQLTATLGRHSGGVFDLCFSPDGKRLTSAGGDKTVKIWDVVSWREVWTLKGHEADVRAVAYSPDGNHLASGSQDQTVKLWDTFTGRELCSSAKYPGYVTGVTFLPDGRRLAVVTNGKSVRIWDSQTGRDSSPLKGHTGGVMDVACCPVAHRLASASTDGTVRVWDTVMGQEVLSVQVDPAMALTVAFSRDGKRLASASGLTLRLWDATPP